MRSCVYFIINRFHKTTLDKNFFSWFAKSKLQIWWIERIGWDTWTPFRQGSRIWLNMLSAQYLVSDWRCSIFGVSTSLLDAACFWFWYFGKLPWAVVDLIARQGGSFFCGSQLWRVYGVRCGDFVRFAGCCLFFWLPDADRHWCPALRSYTLGIVLGYVYLIGVFVSKLHMICSI